MSTKQFEILDLFKTWSMPQLTPLPRNIATYPQIIQSYWRGIDSGSPADVRGLVGGLVFTYDKLSQAIQDRKGNVPLLTEIAEKFVSINADTIERSAQSITADTREKIISLLVDTVGWEVAQEIIHGKGGTGVIEVIQLMLIIEAEIRMMRGDLDLVDPEEPQPVDEEQSELEAVDYDWDEFGDENQMPEIYTSEPESEVPDRIVEKSYLEEPERANQIPLSNRRTSTKLHLLSSALRSIKAQLVFELSSTRTAEPCLAAMVYLPATMSKSTNTAYVEGELLQTALLEITKQGFTLDTVVVKENKMAICFNILAD